MGSVLCEVVFSMLLHYLRGVNFHWNLGFAISLMADSLTLNSAYYYIFKYFSMIADMTETQKSGFANI